MNVEQNTFDDKTCIMLSNLGKKHDLIPHKCKQQSEGFETKLDTKYAKNYTKRSFRSHMIWDSKRNKSIFRISIWNNYPINMALDSVMNYLKSLDIKVQSFFQLYGIMKQTKSLITK